MKRPSKTSMFSRAFGGCGGSQPPRPTFDRDSGLIRCNPVNSRKDSCSSDATLTKMQLSYRERHLQSSSVVGPQRLAKFRSAVRPVESVLFIRSLPELRPVRADRLLVPKVPNPAIRTSSPLASASPMAANTPSTASLAADLLRPVRAANRSAISVLFNRSPPPPASPVPLPDYLHRTQSPWSSRALALASMPAQCAIRRSKGSSTSSSMPSASILP